LGYVKRVDRQPSLALLHLASVLREAKHSPCLLDLNTVLVSDENHPEKSYTSAVLTAVAEQLPGMIGLNCLLSEHFPYMRRLAIALKAQYPKIPIVIGGLHPTLFPTEIIRNCPEIDVAVMGEGEEQIVALANHFSSGESSTIENIAALCFRNTKGKIQQNPRNGFISDLNRLPGPAWDLVNFPDYFTDHSSWHNPRGLDIKMSVPVLTSRSCPYDCSFCSVHPLMGRGLRLRDPMKVVDEMEMLYRDHGLNYFGFLDDNLTLKKSHVMAICNEIVKRGMKIQFESINGYNLASLDEEIIHAMVEAGCVYVILPIEHGSDYIRNNIIGKHLAREKIYEIVSLYKKYNLLTRGYYIMGFPEETHETLMETYNLILELQLDMNNVFNLIPFPGTRIFDQALRDGLFINNVDPSRLWTGEFGLHADAQNEFYIKPYQMEIEELLIFRKKFDELRLFSDRIKSQKCS
jgi:radical SAM superfamily enzyme YgiQ (UPF0313 family)